MDKPTEQPELDSGITISTVLDSDIKLLKQLQLPKCLKLKFL